MSATATDLATEFKTAFREHPAGIALITAAGDEGPVGLTASSVASVSVDPPALVFSVTRATGSAGLLLAADSLLVHLLDARHAAIAQEFAVTGGERFTAEQGWETLPTGEPHLVGVRAALRCRGIETVPVGSSMLVVAEVLDVRVGDRAEPMIYVDRTFRRTGGPL
ncbi:flavin reductase family protein [Leucobacter triazinivorans]|uniref:Flavin reductase n=1 Tax=Leucobacter triazinivorans TaxID=1784719 RepID=A0A4P6KE07_9MICO|nr:flavin reductase family protein [Leucobacter triazinivorans]QBE48423.1 flavin reductase [Leucobacter triazinivorans]